MRYNIYTLRYNIYTECPNNGPVGHYSGGLRGLQRSNSKHMRRQVKSEKGPSGSPLPKQLPDRYC